MNASRTMKVTVLFLLGTLISALLLISPLQARADGGTVQYRSQTQTTAQQLAEIQRLIALINQLRALVAQLDDAGSLDDDDDEGDDDSLVEVTTNAASSIDDDRARLNGEVDFGDSNFAYVWFEWGTDENDLDEETPRVRLDDSDDGDFAVTVTQLDEDEEYHFRAVAEDEDGEEDLGTTRSFTTGENGTDDDDDDNGDEPNVETGDAEVDENDVTLDGEVDMNDFENGTVFVVYGTDENQIEDVEADFDTYADVDEDGENLQKERLDTGLDDQESYEVDITGLDEDTEYFYNFCVEYEDDDNDDALACGTVESFETEN